MPVLCLWFTVRRMLVGAVCGGAIGFPLYYVVYRPTAADDPGLVVAFVGYMAVLGSVAAGFLSATGWAMLAGGIVGAIATGLWGVVATLHLKGLIYSFVGAPFGVLFVLLYRLEYEAAKPSDKARASQAQSGVWGERKRDITDIDRSWADKVSGTNFGQIGGRKPCSVPDTFSGSFSRTDTFSRV